MKLTLSNHFENEKNGTDSLQNYIESEKNETDPLQEASKTPLQLSSLGRG